MTYEELYSQSSTWTARHVAQDLMLMYGRKTVTSQFDVETVNRWQLKEGGPAILLASQEHNPIAVAAYAPAEPMNQWSGIDWSEVEEC